MELATRSRRAGRTRPALVLIVVVLLCGCATGHLDVKPFCERVTAMKSASALQRYFELENVADLAVRMSPEHGHARVCGDDLRSWLTRELSARPLVLDNQLLPKIDAMGVLCRNDAWSDSCIQTLASLVLLSEHESRLVMYTAYTFLGPGSQKIDLGLTPEVALADVRLRSARALSSGAPAITHGYLEFLQRVWDAPAPALHRLFVAETIRASADWPEFIRVLCEAWLVELHGLSVAQADENAATWIERLRVLAGAAPELGLAERAIIEARRLRDGATSATLRREAAVTVAMLGGTTD